MYDRNPLKKFFQLSVKEASAFRLFLPALAILVLYKPVGWWMFPPTVTAFTIDIRADSLLNPNQVVRVEKFFDPNSVSTKEMESFGLDSTLVFRMNRYRESGGRFRKAGDLLRLYGMDSSIYRQLEPWVRIVKPDSPARTSPSFRRPPRPQPKTFDLNRADTSDFEAIPGIGFKTAARIMKYRSALGGFINKDQLYEIWAIDSLAVFSMSDFFVSGAFRPVLLDINNATEAQLELHPYLSRLQAKAILFYRFQHGAFKTVGELRKVRLLDSATFHRIRPYVGIEVH